MDDQNRIIAGLILRCKPEDLMGVAQKADGSLAVVAPNGMKFVFSPVELDNARDSFCLPVVTSTGSVTGLGSADGLGSPDKAGLVTETPLAELVEASGHGAPASIPARQKSSCGIGAGSVTEAPMAEPVEAREHGAPNPPTSTSSVTGSGSAYETSRRHRKEARL